MTKLLSVFLIFVATCLPTRAARAAAPAALPTEGERGAGVPEFWVRPGYRVTLAAQNFGQARFMEFGPDEVLYVSQPGKGALVAFNKPGADGVYGAATTILTGYPKIHGLCLADDGYLYFTTTGAIYRFKPGSDLTAKPEVQTVIAEGQLPASGGHWWRSIVVKGGYLWTSIGDQSNIGEAEGSEREKIWRFKTDGSDKTLWCTGIRNTEKLRFRPGTDSLYGCDHGSDNLGARYGEKGGGPITDVFPPEEFNRYVQGLNYGHPYVTGLGLPRPEFANRPDVLQLVENNTPPVWCFHAHWANCGWTFLGTDELGMKGDALIASHGSWNSRQKVGYRVERLCFDAATGKPYGSMPMVTTTNESGSQVYARPVDVVEAPDGSVLFSDDSGGKIYRISRIN